ncbi:flagellar motor protein MotP [Sutcliffiella horikoshii]|uniref:flagellar motor protein MotP n=1 Tax=Sutcliffiella horikoshii TaxID=79883 RepID=UPI003CEF7435
MKKFDMLTPIGIVLGLAMIMFGILSGNGLAGLASFLDPASLFIVLGGTAGALFISFNMKELKLVPVVVKAAFSRKEMELPVLINTFVRLADRARREGLLALEAELEDVEDEFIKKGILLAVDGVEPEVINDIMNAEISAMEERHLKGKTILDKAGEYAPAWGMIGTLIGLVLMLNNLNDPTTLGPNMAIAILTTLYGSLIANLICIPMANKLGNKTEKEVFLKQIIIEGVIGVQSGQNPKILEEKLSAFLTSRDRVQEEVMEMEALEESVR